MVVEVVVEGVVEVVVRAGGGDVDGVVGLVMV